MKITAEKTTLVTQRTFLNINVDEAEFNALIEKGRSQEEALKVLIETGKATILDESKSDRLEPVDGVEPSYEVNRLQRMNAVTFLARTGGDGLYTSVSKDVLITGLRITMYEIQNSEESEIWATAALHFDPNTWDEEKDDSIYGDKTFIERVNAYFELDEGFGYSEYGAQGRDYVHVDVPGADLLTLLKNGYVSEEGNPPSYWIEKIEANMARSSSPKP